jgi:hypothetical protein
MPSRRLAAAAALTLLVLIAPAAARADTEPNNGLLQAEGPIAGGQAHDGASGTDNDTDWYVFYANSQVELDITTSASEDCEGRLYLMDADGSTIDSTYIEQDAVNHIQYTTPVGVNRFYLQAWCNYTGRHYRFTINPAAGVTTGPAAFGPTTPLGEPNESRGQALGPLAGGVDYEGVKGTDNDEDWFYFYATGPRALEITATASDNCDGQLSLYNSRGSQLATTYPDNDEVHHIRYTAPSGTRKLYLTGYCDNTGTHYQFRIDPADAIVAAPPPPPGPTAACTTAIAKRTIWRNRVRALKRKVARADTVRQWRKYRRKLSRAKVKLSKANASVRANCI